MAKSLADLQAALQRDIMGQTTDTLDRLSVPAGATPESRLFVYQHAYVARLVEILSEDYDTTWSFVGDQTFYELAQGFVAKYPSNTPNARWFSHRFPDFLSEEQVGKDAPAVVEIARFERALADAFDAADDPVFSQEMLAELAATGIEEATFALHSATQLLRCDTNAYDIFKALRNEEVPPAMSEAPEPRWVLIWRRDMTCRHMEIDAEQGALLDLARRGHGFVSLCEFAATLGDPETAAMRMAGYLGQWIENHILSGQA